MGKTHKKHKKEQKKEKEEDLEDVDYNQLARMELLKLQRQYRLMQGTQRAAAEEAGTTISRQQRVMTFLFAEKEDLETDFKNAACKQNQTDDAWSRKYITSLIQLYDEHQAKIKSSIDTIEEMEDQVDKITQRVIQQNLKIQGLFGMSLTPAAATKRLGTLENRLYQMTTRFDTLVSENVRIRSDINTILMERGRYHKRSLFIKRCVSRMKKKMMDIVDVATQIYEARDEYAGKIRILRERDDKESRQHVLELKEWSRVLHDDEKQHRFMATKYQDRNVIEKDADRENRHQREQEKLLDYILMKYKRSFKAIISLGVSKDVESLCHQYMDRDLKNFTNFKYISDINNEIEVIRDTIDIIKQDIKDLGEKSTERTVNQTEGLIQEKEQMKNIQNTLNSLDIELFKRSESLNEFVYEFEKLFYLLHCDNASIIRLLGNSDGMNALNVNLCVTVIEKTVSALMKEKNILTIRKQVEKEGKALPSKQQTGGYIGGSDKPKAGGGPFKPKLVMTGRMDAGDDDNNEDEKLMTSGRLTYEQLKESILEKLKLAAADGTDSEIISSRESLMDVSDSSISPGNDKEGKPSSPRTRSPHEESDRGAEAPKISPPGAEAPKISPPGAEAPKISPPGAEAPKISSPGAEAPKISPPGAEAPKESPPAVEAPKEEAPAGPTESAQRPNVNIIEGLSGSSHAPDEDEASDDDD